MVAKGNQSVKKSIERCILCMVPEKLAKFKSCESGVDTAPLIGVYSSSIVTHSNIAFFSLFRSASFEE
jgi:hypothetical protein